jgi:ATPase subunit of ABC transporter with duplicated ATPase domains
LRGANGAGKTTLLRALAGDLEARSRSRGFAEAKVDFALFDQRLEIADPDKKLFEHFQEISKLEMSAARRRLGRVGFEQEIQEKALVSLSGGERVRLHLQALLAQTPSPKLLLLDEPTNHLDLESRLILVEFVKSFSGAILLVSHDERFARDCGIEEEVRLL